MNSVKTLTKLRVAKTPQGILLFYILKKASLGVPPATQVSPVLHCGCLVTYPDPAAIDLILSTRDTIESF